LFAAITRLLWWGFALYTVGIVSGFFTGHPLPRVQVMAAIALWLALRGNLASPPSQVARAKTCGHVMHYWLQRCSGASMGNHIHRGAASPAMNLFCIGLSHHTANVATREQFAGNATAESIARQAGCAEALLLMTCNRVEVYGVSNKWISTDEIGRCLIGKNKSRFGQLRASIYRYEDTKCVQHLFRVASGLDSMVVGESEIFGQAKKAYESARTSGAVGPYLHRLFQRAFRVAKQVRHAHRHCARRGVGRFRRGRISSTDFLANRRL